MGEYADEAIETEEAAFMDMPPEGFEEYETKRRKIKKLEVKRLTIWTLIPHNLSVLFRRFKNWMEARRSKKRGARVIRDNFESD